MKTFIVSPANAGVQMQAPAMALVKGGFQISHG